MERPTNIYIADAVATNLRYCDARLMCPLEFNKVGLKKLFMTELKQNQIEKKLRLDFSMVIA